MLFTKQPAFCSNCGKGGEYSIKRGWIACSRECAEDLMWKETLYILGKDYYPRPEKEAE
jgi:hypothetical protein